eukprot:1159249-Pelagomonas_calceolata.AAC.2
MEPDSSKTARSGGALPAHGSSRWGAEEAQGQFQDHLAAAAAVCLVHPFAQHHRLLAAAAAAAADLGTKTPRAASRPTGRRSNQTQTQHVLPAPPPILLVHTSWLACLDAHAAAPPAAHPPLLSSAPPPLALPPLPRPLSLHPLPQLLSPPSHTGPPTRDGFPPL